MAAPLKSTLTENQPIEVVPVTPYRQIKVVYIWKAPSRSYKRQSKDFWTTVVSIAFLLGVIFLLIGEWLAVILIASIVFVYYVFSTVPPEEVEHGITNVGVRFAGKDYLWEQLSQYWITEKWGKKIINLGFPYGFIRSIQLLATEQEAKEIDEILKKYLPNEAMPPTFTDKAADWLAKKIPLEIT